jgi:hypothetical protein
LIYFVGSDPFVNMKKANSNDDDKDIEFMKEFEEFKEE